MAEDLPFKTYSPLHYAVLEADAWAHKVGVKRIALDRTLDAERELKLDELMSACFDAFESYTLEEKAPDVTLHGDLAYAIRIMAKIAGPNEETTTIKFSDIEKVCSNAKRFGFVLIKRIADIYNGSVGVGEQIQRVQLEYYKGDKERGEIKTAYVALNRNELVLEEVA